MSDSDQSFAPDDNDIGLEEEDEKDEEDVVEVIL